MFTDGIFGEGLGVDDAAESVWEVYEDYYLSDGIGVYWCSPPANEGCSEGSYFYDAWLDFKKISKQISSPQNSLQTSLQ